uniref:Uncharacterized protein n=1 Tax=Trichogramma kaykai TaxID=54128 RepID=A0ABD2VWY0_9HYME
MCLPHPCEQIECYKPLARQKQQQQQQQLIFLIRAYIFIKYVHNETRLASRAIEAHRRLHRASIRQLTRTGSLIISGFQPGFRRNRRKKRHRIGLVINHARVSQLGRKFINKPLENVDVYLPIERSVGLADPNDQSRRKLIIQRNLSEGAQSSYQRALPKILELIDQAPLI